MSDNQTVAGVTISPVRPHSYVRMRTPDADRLAALAEAEDAKVKRRGNRVRIGGMLATRIAELAADEHIVIHAMNPDRVLGWYRGAIRDTQAWKIRGYFLMKPVIASFHLVVAAGFWLAGLFYLTYPAWQEWAGAGLGSAAGTPCRWPHVPCSSRSARPCSWHRRG